MKKDILKPNVCGGCLVEPGEFHQQGCDWERCPRCGGQSIACECIYVVNDLNPSSLETLYPEIYVGGPTEEMYEKWDSLWGGDRRVKHNGFYPGWLEAIEYDMWCYWGPPWTICSKGHPEATPDLNRLHALATWSWKDQRYYIY